MNHQHFVAATAAAALVCTALLATPAHASNTGKSAKKRTSSTTQVKRTTATRSQGRSSKQRAVKIPQRTSVLQVNPFTGANAPAEPLPGVTGTTFPAPSPAVLTGDAKCELGVTVTIRQDANDAYSYLVTTNRRHRYHMREVPTLTGAIRLEDKSTGTVWLQLGNKSMLLDQRQGQRIATECRTPQQELREQELLQTPPAGNLLD